MANPHPLLVSTSTAPRVAKVVEPKRKKLLGAQQQLEAANAALAEKQGALQAVVERVEGVRRQLAEAQAEQKRLNEQVRC